MRDGEGRRRHRCLAGRGPGLGSNEYLSYSVATGVGQATEFRRSVFPGDVVIAVGGEDGTLSEVGLALKMGRPVVSLG